MYVCSIGGNQIGNLLNSDWLDSQKGRRDERRRKPSWVGQLKLKKYLHMECYH